MDHFVLESRLRQGEELVRPVDDHRNPARRGRVRHEVEVERDEARERGLVRHVTWTSDATPWARAPSVRIDAKEGHEQASKGWAMKRL